MFSVTELYSLEQSLLPINMRRLKHSISNDTCVLSFPESQSSKLTNFTKLRSIVREFVPRRFSTTTRDFCWHSHLDLTHLPTIHNLIDKYSKYELTISDAVQGIKEITRESNPPTLTCLPAYYILGFPKCGSTYLYEILSKHPSIRSAREKEPHFWTKFPFQNHVYDQYSFLTYLANFNGHGPINTRGDISVIDGSQSTMWSTEHASDLCAVPRLLRETTPTAKFIVLMRDPVDQLYSDFWHFTLKCKVVIAESAKQQVMYRTFTSIVTKELIRLKTCLNGNSGIHIDECIHLNILTAKAPFHGCNKVRLGVGIYVTFIKRWFKFFNRDQFLFLRLEDMAANPYKLFTKVWSFIDIEPMSVEGFESVVSSTPRALSNYPPLNKDTRETLEKFFAPFNNELAILLNDTNFRWQ